VGPGETALDVQERIGSVMNTLCFPDQQLIFNGKTIPNNQSMSACGIKDGDAMELVIQASEDTFEKQLSELLGKQALSPQELSLLYIHRHATSVNDVLAALGHANGDFHAFLGGQKCFSFDGALVKVAQAQKKVLQSQEKAPQNLNKLCPIQENKMHGTIGVRVSVEIHVPGRNPVSPSYNDDDENMGLVRVDASDTVAKVKEIIAASEQIPFPDRHLEFQGTKLKDGLSLNEAGVTNGAFLVMVVHASVAALASQLEGLLLEHVGLSASDLGLLYCQRFGTPVCQALRTLGLPANLKRFLEGQDQFSIRGGCVTLANGPKLITPPAQDEDADVQ